MAGKREVKVVISGDSSGAQSAAEKSATALDKTGTAGTRMANGMSKALSSLGSRVGGELGEVLNTVGEGFDRLGEHGHGALAKLEAAGGAAIGVGTLLTGLGDKEKAASQQLDQAITNTGNNAEEFTKQIDSTVHHMEKFGDSAGTTKDALATLVNATHDPTKAMSLMGEAADLAASRHESLTAASDQLARLLGGKGAKVLAAYGIQVKTNADGTKDYAGANEQLAKILSGQASAASDTLTGKFKALRTEVSDNVAEFGQKWGPTITAVGAGAMVLGPVFKGIGSGVSAVRGHFTEMEASTGALAEAVQASASSQLASFGEVAAGAQATATTAIKADEEMIGGNEAVAESSKASKASMLGGVAVLAAVATAADIGGRKLSSMEESGNALAHTLDGMGHSTDSLRTALLNNAGATDEVSKQWIGAQLQSTGLADKAAKVGITVDQMTSAIMGGAGSTARLVQEWRASGKPSGDTISALIMLAGGYAKTSSGAKDLGTTTKQLGDVQLTAAQKAADQKAALDSLDTALTTLGQTEIAQVQSQDSFLSSLDSLTQSVKDNGTSLDVNTTKGRANREQFAQSASAALQWAQNQRKAGVDIGTVTGNLNKNITALVSQGEKLGMNKTQVQALIKQMGLTPKQINTKFNVDTAAAWAKLTSLEDKAAFVSQLLASGDVTDYLTYANKMGNVSKNGDRSSGNAVGTSFWRGGMTFLNEDAPELVDLPTGSRVWTGSQSDFQAAAIRGGAGADGGGDQTLTVNLVVDGNVLHQALLKVRRGKGGIGLGLG